MALVKEHLLKIAFTSRFCYASIIFRPDPQRPGTEVCSASTAEPEVRQALIEGKKSCSDTQAAALVGRLIAQRALEQNVDSVHFRYARDQRYNGKLKSMLDSVREGGLPLK
jgi:large subunit ribosomal protein L18